MDFLLGFILGYVVMVAPLLVFKSRTSIPLCRYRYKRDFRPEVRRVVARMTTEERGIGGTG